MTKKQNNPWNGLDASWNGAHKAKPSLQAFSKTTLMPMRTGLPAHSTST